VAIFAALAPTPASDQLALAVAATHDPAIT